jgi:hypothetical protein
MRKIVNDAAASSDVRHLAEQILGWRLKARPETFAEPSGSATQRLGSSRPDR